MKPIIKVENLGKQYRIGASCLPYRTLRETLIQSVRKPLNWVNRNGASEDNTIWALQNVGFEVMPGEVVGVIGRNGAGKSTLLKLLSRITDPTIGKIDLYGRVGSLLEVGTGFHAELTGRENIYLNGAILGMRRSEISKKLDEIIDFAEVDRFIDTPVKHYSSGMYTRLAFAVAAHLEPEVLIIDEVLAVGDAIFQKKCLGKMGYIAQQGRTVIFVSHNMQAVQSLCDRGIYLEKGSIVREGDTEAVVAHYLSQSQQSKSSIEWDSETAPGNAQFRLIKISVTDANGYSQSVYSSNSPIYVELVFDSQITDQALRVGFDLIGFGGEMVARIQHNDTHPDYWPAINVGRNTLRCEIQRGLLNMGLYYISAKISIHNSHWIVSEDSIVQFEVVLDHGVSPFWNGADRNNKPGVIAPIFSWTKLSSS